MQTIYTKLIKKYLKVTKTWTTRHPILDALIVLLGVVFLWRGIWGLLDTYLFPGNPLYSYTVCAILGLAILFLDDFELKEL